MPDPGPVAVFAPAKINLTLHVTGQRADGYHLLDSLVVFADVGDWVHLAPADRLTLAITGPQAAALPVSDDNLVLRAARLMGGACAAITLEKRLPVASGIGGGSADAAAALRACAEMWGCALPAAAEVLALGADVPVCLAGRPVRMTGVGEGLVPLAQPLPAGWLVLANPGVAVPTPAVFRALTKRDNAPMPGVLPQFATLAALAAFLHAQRNDLEPPAMQLAPVIASCKAALAAQRGCLLARMSGSGATCFGLFADERAAIAAEAALQAAEPGWWVAAGALRA
jgi:4-diphosphocytidyl-2-C-methyl-D-erythritol kinase